ncbi:hypothetical protein B0H10DRAFT_2223325 [Mycena sp. CBHHK59/15]|nr:hypothetical protein B0H10DRAFT_2223325 [Mycena sp. CBHHK59/15]
MPPLANHNFPELGPENFFEDAIPSPPDSMAAPPTSEFIVAIPSASLINHLMDSHVLSPTESAKKLNAPVATAPYLPPEQFYGHPMPFYPAGAAMDASETTDLSTRKRAGSDAEAPHPGKRGKGGPGTSSTNANSMAAADAELPAVKRPRGRLSFSHDIVNDWFIAVAFIILVVGILIDSPLITGPILEVNGHIM